MDYLLRSIKLQQAAMRKKSGYVAPREAIVKPKPKGLMATLQSHGGKVTNRRWGISCWSEEAKHHTFTAWTDPEALRKMPSGLYEYVPEWFDCAKNPGPAEALRRMEEDIAANRLCKIVAVENDEDHEGKARRVLDSAELAGWWKVTMVKRDPVDLNHCKYRIEQISNK